MARLEGRVAIVTGGARGIGFGVAQRFASEGATVVIVDLQEGDAIEAAGRLPTDAPHLGIGADVGDSASATAAVERTVQELGHLDILMNNAGITRDNLLHKMSDADWAAVISVHLTGAFLMSRAAQTHFVTQRSGRILNVSSTSALGNRGQANYAAAKAGMQGFTKTLAIELGRHGVTVNAIAPGFVETEMTHATAARMRMEFADFEREAAKAIPIGRIGQPEDIANLAAFLVSDGAGFISGQVIYVAGGPVD